MSDELYYRGSSSYEIAVKNRLSALEAQGAKTTHAIRDMSLEVSGTIRQSTYAILASQEALGRTFVHGFNALNNNIMIGFDMVGSKLDEMKEEICERLDKIHDILNNPLLTASRELYRRAFTNYEKGYFEEALEDCKAAVEKNKTDFISWSLLGQIYLFGAGKFSNVIDLGKAEESFSTAAKYIDADIEHSGEARKFASEIYYYLGYTKLIISNDLLVANNAEESNTKLVEAEGASKRAYKISKENLIAGYEQAKELHFLGNDVEALRILEKVIRSNKNYALRASCDKNFESLWNKIDELISRLRDESVELLKKEFLSLKDTLEKLSSVENKPSWKDERPKYTISDKEGKKEKEVTIKSRLHKLENVSDLEGMDYFSVKEIEKTLLLQLKNDVNGIIYWFNRENEELAKFFGFIVDAINSGRGRIFKKGNVYGTNQRTAIYLHVVSNHIGAYLSLGYSENGVTLRLDYDTVKSLFGGLDCYMIPYQVEHFFDMPLDDNETTDVPLMPYVEKLKTRADICYPNSNDDVLHKVLAELNKAFDNLPEGTNGCYIATSVYGSYDCPQVWTLRRYRDYKLAETWYGRTFIRAYYAVSPTIVKYFGETAWFKSLWRAKLDRMVKNLKDLGFADTPYNDIEW
jgi:tetratricopeptide (TPR) repeat protein